MKKLLCIMLVAIMFLLSGCNRGVEVLKNDKYAIRQNDEGFFLEFHDDSYETEYRRQKASSSGVSGAKAATGIGFPSIAKMKETIKNGDFTDKQLVQMQHFVRAGGDKVAVCDLNNLYDARLPESVNLKGVSWFGKTYSFSFSGDVPGTYYGNINLVEKEFCDKRTRNTDLKSEGNAEAITVVSEGVDPQTNGTVTCYEYNGLKKQILYTYTDGENTMTVDEKYAEEENGLEVPFGISFWGNCGNQYYYGYIYGLKERPSYEWIKSFGLTPFVEKEVA